MASKVIRLACVIAAGSVLAACGAFQGRDISPVSIKNYTWVLSSVNGELPAGNKPVTVNFEPQGATDGRVFGTAQCNNYFGEYTTDGDTITFGTIGSSRMACDPASMQQEMAFIGSFATINTIKLKGHQLILDGGENTLSFFAEAAKVNGDINYQGTLPAGAEVVIRLQDTSLADAPAITIAEKIIKIEEPTAGPLSFSLNYAPQLLRNQHSYSLNIHAAKDGNLLYTNTSRIEVGFDRLTHVELE